MSDVGKAGSDQKSNAGFPVGIALLLLVLASPVGLILVLPFLAPIYAHFVPAYSASANLEPPLPTVKLQFHRTDDPDGGRYLTVYGPVRSARVSMCGYDWAHYGRPSSI